MSDREEALKLAAKHGVVFMQSAPEPLKTQTGVITPAQLEAIVQEACEQAQRELLDEAMEPVGYMEEDEIAELHSHRGELYCSVIWKHVKLTEVQGEPELENPVRLYRVSETHAIAEAIRKLED